MSVTTYSLMDPNSNSVQVAGFDNVKSQKLKALRKYRRKQAPIWTLIHVAEFCVVLYLIFSLYSSTGATFAGYFLRRMSYLSGKPLCVFFFCHFIIATIFIVSVFSNDSSGRNVVGSNMFDEYLYHRRLPESGYSPATKTSPEVEARPDNKQIVPYENSKENRALTVSKRPVRPLVDGSVCNTVPPSPVRETSNSTADLVSRPVLAIQDTEVVTVTANHSVSHPVLAIQDTEVVTVTADHSVSPVKDVTAGERKKYRRSRSGVMSKKVENRPELRRMVTEVGRKSVEELSNEEFKTTVEEYIARTKMFLQSELMDELTSKEGYKVVNNCRSLVVRN